MSELLPRLRTCDTGIWRVRNWFIIIIIIICVKYTVGIYFYRCKLKPVDEYN